MMKPIFHLFGNKVRSVFENLLWRFVKLPLCTLVSQNVAFSWAVKFVYNKVYINVYYS